MPKIPRNLKCSLQQLFQLYSFLINMLIIIDMNLIFLCHLFKFFKNYIWNYILLHSKIFLLWLLLLFLLWKSPFTKRMRFPGHVVWFRLLNPVRMNFQIIIITILHNTIIRENSGYWGYFLVLVWLCFHDIENIFLYTLSRSKIS